MKKYLIVLAFVLIATLQVKAQTRAQDSLALIDLYNSTNGPGWRVNWSWLTNDPINRWYGVTVENDRVVKIFLGSNNLSGKIPQSIKDLESLDELDMSSNALTDSLPSSIGNLVHLTSLRLHRNQISGAIPVSIGNLVKLKSIYLFSNLLSGGIPDGIKNLTQLNYLNFYNNKLSGEITPSLGELSQLFTMDLSGNLFTGTIPASFTKLSKLTVLQIFRNQLSGSIPPFIFTLPELQTIELDRNQFTGSIPDSAVNLAKIKDLWLNGNHLTGTIPDWLGNSQFITPRINDNNFNFDGMEGLVSKKSYSLYSPQNKIPLNYSNRTLSATAGGTLSNDTFRLYKNNILIDTKKGDSTFSISNFSNTDSFYISVTNTIATRLTLYTETRSFSGGYKTIANGNWNDPAIWSGGTVPAANAEVSIMNQVTVNTNVTCYSLHIVPPSGNVMVQSGYNLTVTH